MAFEEIECVKPVRGMEPLSSTGVRVRPRQFKAKYGIKHWIEVLIGKTLAARLHLLSDTGNMRLLIGTGADAGTLGLTMDAAGRFSARRRKNGSYALVINAASAEVLFSLSFPDFSVPDVAVLAPPGKASFATFAVPAAMLAAD